MLDLSAVAMRLAGRPGRDAVVAHAHRVRIGERCSQHCPGCRALPTLPQFDPMVVRHALYTLEPHAQRVLLAGADPLWSASLFEAIGLARGLGLAVEVLTPGPVSETAARALLAAGVERVRVTLNCLSPGRLGRIRSAAAVTRVGLLCDLQLSLRPGQRYEAFEELLDEATMLPVARIVVSTRGCRLAEEATDQRLLMRATASMVERALSASPPEAALCIEEPGFHVRLVLDEIDRRFGLEIARRAGDLMVSPRYATAPG